MAWGHGDMGMWDMGTWRHRQGDTEVARNVEPGAGSRWNVAALWDSVKERGIGNPCTAFRKPSAGLALLCCLQGNHAQALWGKCVHSESVGFAFFP